MDIFALSFIADETYLQTILRSYKPDRLENSNKMAARYIDWERGRPYTFTMPDVPELGSVANTQFAFARKVNNPEIVSALFKNS